MKENNVNVGNTPPCPLPAISVTIWHTGKVWNTQVESSCIRDGKFPFLSLRHIDIKGQSGGEFGGQGEKIEKFNI